MAVEHKYPSDNFILLYIEVIPVHQMVEWIISPVSLGSNSRTEERSNVGSKTTIKVMKRGLVYIYQPSTWVII